MNYRTLRMPDFDAIPRRDYLMAVLSGGLLALAFPSPGISPLAWIAFAPLLLACGRKDPRKAFHLGFVTGLTAYAGILYWITIVVTTYGKLPWIVSVGVLSMLVSYLALYPAVVAYLVRRGEDRGISLLISFPLLWVGLEYGRAFLVTGFPWASLGYTQYRTLPLIQIADITGVYGLSFLIALANVVFYRIIRGFAARERAPYPVKSVVLLLALLLATVAYGFKRLHVPESGEPFKVALIQGNIDQNIKWDPSFQEETVAIYERLSRKACAAGPSDLLVWPESAAPFYFQDEPRYASRIKGLAKELKTCAVVGSPAYEKDGERLKYLNSAFLLSPWGDVLGRSDKIHLVPFGEYVPMAKLLPFVNKLVAGIGDFSPGAQVAALDTGKGRIGILVCFEGIFPELSRAYVRAGSRLLVNITNDAWFGRSSAPYQHLSMTVFRAVENRVPLVRAANTGITSIIDSKGHIRGMTSLFEEAVLNGEVRLGEGESFYNRYGDVFAWACVAGGAIVTALAFGRKRIHHQ
ncbi:apolipoprotein N-acyltransferase [Geobacter hydrogenophilus]|uniref:Apolipoprotein N-acyltransferase n=1 Tax=Geobacter hydrogenophilus TaxID=40983 RepID=A0A9W6G3I6_9BACT|nr:apolipoprotein N-acyltransferase [Geobacter hydrogenophilus]MBT0892321.1 apolipoprotein N-acyltransferase [Geobacter hydrogenophilus]GLI39714.1 apolipoprotein N-acyltransferase [Geobacter hydrogenophilus]